MPEDPTQASTCDWCGKLGATFRNDPFKEEVYDDEDPAWICDDCYAERRLEV